MESEKELTTAPAVQPPELPPDKPPGSPREYEFAWIINKLLAQPIKVGFGRSFTPPPPETEKLLDTDLVEMYPVFSPITSNFPLPKGKSLTEAELRAQVMNPQDIKAQYERLKAEAPPPSLQQVRERRTSIKQDRKRAIDFIRSRTNSRAAALGIPIINGVPDLPNPGRTRAMSFAPGVGGPINDLKENSPSRNRAMSSSSAGVMAPNYRFPVFDLKKTRTSLESLEEDEKRH